MKNAHTVCMCGRFHLGFSNKEAQKIIRNIPDEQQIQLRFGDIYPTSYAPILTAEESIAARWGFERFDKKGVLINARAETVTQRQTKYLTDMYFASDYIEKDNQVKLKTV